MRNFSGLFLSPGLTAKNNPIQLYLYREWYNKAADLF